MKRERTFIGFILILSFLLVSNVPSKTITIKGSDTMLPLVQKWAEAFMKVHPGISIQVIGGGSGTGIDALITGVIDICDASRELTKEEIEIIKHRFSTIGVEIPCARDGITIFLNETNPVSEMTLEQIGEIFSGKITSWKQVGGNPAPINLYGRETNSGTYDVFKQDVVKSDYSRSCQPLSGNVAIVNAVIKDPNGIGYGGAAFATGVKRCKVKVDDSTPGYEAGPETMRKGLYPISRYLYMYTRTRPTGEIKTFIDWILGADGQKIVSEWGYFPL